MDTDEHGQLSKLTDPRYKRKTSAFFERVFVQLSDKCVKSDRALSLVVMVEVVVVVVAVGS